MAVKEGPLAAAPAFFIFVSLCVSILLGVRTSAPASVIAAVSALFSAAAIFAGTERTVPGWRRIFALVIILSFVLSFISAARTREQISFPDSFEAYGKILLARDWGKTRAYLIETPYGRAAAYSRENLREGAGVRLRAASFDFKRAEERGGFDEMLFWRGKGAVKKLELFEIRETSAPSGLAAWRAHLDELFRARLYPLSAAYMSALTTGRRSAAIEEPHERAGTIHLLSVSGFHVGVLAGLLFFLKRGGAARTVTVSALLWLYVAFAGFPPGGVRAAAMAQICIAAEALGRPYSSFNNVSAAACLMLLYNPWSFFDVGWRLSVLAALFITAGVRLVGRGFAGAAATSVLVWFVSAPVVAEVFSSVPVAGLTANLVAVPYFAVVFPLIFALSLPPLLGLPLAPLFAETSELILRFSQSALDALASLTPAQVGYSTPLFVLAAAIFCSAAALRCGAPLRRAPFIVLFSLAVLLYFRAVL